MPLPLLALPFLSGLKTAVVGLISGTFKFVTEHPRAALEIVVVVGTAVGSWYWTKERVAKEKDAFYQPIIQQYAGEIEALNTKVKDTEESSAKAAEEAQTKINDANAKIESLTGDYEAKLAEERARKKGRIQTVYVPLPGVGTDGKPKEVEVTLENGEVVCRRLPETYKDTVNSMIREANKAITGGK